ncbi:MAG: oligosaccharide flippase family protein [Candidatus Aminicenantes bacterium]|nr:oligosaccharide flippase family protein [Candidatus Aminicenantes bacterium]
MGINNNKPMEAKREFMTSLFWASSSSGLAKLIDLITLVALARLLDPFTFGLVAIAVLVMNTLGLFSNLGLGAALIQKDKITDDENNTVFLTTPMLNVLIYVIAFLLAHPAARFFGTPEVANIIKVLALILVIQSLSTVPSALLQKKLNYKKLLLSEMTASIVYFMVSVGLALNGMGVWSLVFGQLARYFAAGIVLWAVCGWRPKWNFRWGSFRSLFSFGKHIVFLGVISFVLKNLDNAVIAKFLSAGDLGLYTIAYTIGNILPQFIKMTVGRVAFPVYSKWDEDYPDFRRRFLIINKVNLIFCSWATLLLITISGPFVSLFLGGKWVASVVMIQILALFGFQRAVASVCAPALNAMNVPQAQREPMILNSVIFVPLVIPAAKYIGVVGVAALATISIIPGFIWIILRTFRLLKIQNELWNFFRPLSIAGLSLGAWALLEPVISNLGLLSLIISFFLISIVFWGIMWAFEKKLFSQLYQLKEVVRSAA